MRVALAQICTSGDTAANLDLVRERVAEAAAHQAALVVFPEATMRAFGHNLAEVAEPLDGPWANQVRRIAADAGLTVAVGMFTPGDHGKVRNTLLITGPDTEAHYDKIHLFDAFGFAESDTVDPGTEQVRFSLGGISFGASICYDARFPQLYLNHARAGAEVMIVSASWGSGPGKAEQWQLVCRARAADSTSYVLACGQANPAYSGVDAPSGPPTGVGHSLIASPTGEIVASAGDGPELIIYDLDPAVVPEVRQALPVLVNAKLS